MSIFCSDSSVSEALDESFNLLVGALAIWPSSKQVGRSSFASGQAKVAQVMVVTLQPVLGSPSLFLIVQQAWKQRLHCFACHHVVSATGELQFRDSVSAERFECRRVCAGPSLRSSYWQIVCEPSCEENFVSQNIYCIRTYLTW
jgi:hypothetical protein